MEAWASRGSETKGEGRLEGVELSCIAIGHQGLGVRD